MFVVPRVAALMIVLYMYFEIKSIIFWNLLVLIYKCIYRVAFDFVLGFCYFFLTFCFGLQSDIRKWFMKQHDKGSGNGIPAKPKAPEKPAPVSSQPDQSVSLLFSYIAALLVQF